jgi:tetratricopeptide (TPR) repeat protein
MSDDRQRGLALRAQGDLAGALTAFAAALAAEPEALDTQLYLGQTLVQLGRVTEGFAAITQAAKRFHAGEGEAGPVSKQRHDAEQRDWLAAHGIAPAPGLHLEGGGQITRAINPANAAHVTQAWVESDPKIVVIDDLLTADALEGLRRFCFGSTMWRTWFEGGYVGAVPETGFACPLLAQIVEEFRDTFPAIFGPHLLHYLWAFKYDPTLSGINVHADLAALNINFWITPTEANLDPEHGGLVLWDKAAPLDWDFSRYNRDEAAITDYLATSGAKAVTVPYRANRAVLFDSDLFHATDSVRFTPGYENRRINVTLLYGQRAERRR